MSQKSSNNPRDLLEDFELKGVLNNEKKVIEFCYACCRLIWDKLPKIAQDALLVSENYLENTANKEDLEKTRISLWKHLGDDYMDFSNPRIASIRAVICGLYQIKSEDEAFNCMNYVMDFCNCVEPKYTEQYRLLLEIFKD